MNTQGEEENRGRLSVVATPIGNMEDITIRALRVFAAADYVLCEDTRVTGKLMKYHSVEAKLRRYDAHSSARVEAEVLTDLEAGKHVALVSDAGTPGVSDPGVLLVAAARAAGARVDAIPGASAVTAAVSIAGIAGNAFTFLGFIPTKKGRQTFITSLATYDHPVAFFESTHRILKLLESLHIVYPTSTIHIAREITKMHEEMVLGNPAEVLAYFEAHHDHQRGEFVVLWQQ